MSMSSLASLGLLGVLTVFVAIGFEAIDLAMIPCPG